MRLLGMWLGLVVASACDAAPKPEPEPPAKVEPAVEVEPVVEVEPEPIAKVEPPELVEPTPVATFDPNTALEFRARIVEVHNRKNWVPCGYIHSVGALEVEVVDVGEPPPRVLLFVSCPVDRHGGPRLEAGTLVEVTLHARKQSWPSVGGLPKQLPRRYVKSLTEPGLPGDPG
ncbi:hypothetical protein ACNOYE_26370 [Nannocystaceae bacterium ST9]